MNKSYNTRPKIQRECLPVIVILKLSTIDIVVKCIFGQFKKKKNYCKIKFLTKHLFLAVQN